MVIGGLFDAAIGVTDLTHELGYWSLFGYHERERGRLSAAEARALYRVDSALTTVRLQHGESDHSLIRFMLRERPLGSGLGYAPLRTNGSRWLVQKTKDFSEILNHCEQAQDEGGEIFFTPPFFQSVAIDQTPNSPIAACSTSAPMMPRSASIAMSSG
ncbi:MAG: hypothetical protein EXQ85_08465 [Alphaproteobacteria bacterium]|nr:hypothetical protein [Alphaproteobacteria bacterium]